PYSRVHIFATRGKKKRPGASGAGCGRRGRLELAEGVASGGRSDLHDVGRLRTAASHHDLELDLLALFEGLEALLLDRGVVDEDVLSAVPLNEAVSLLVAEPLDSSLFHEAGKPPRC